MLPEMSKFICLITAIFLALTSVFPYVVNAQTPTPEPNESREVSFKSKPSVVTFFRTSDDSSLSTEIKFDLKSVPKKALVEEASLNFTQDGTSSGILKIIDKTNGEIVDSLAMGTEGKRSSDRIDTISQSWISTPAENFGLIFQTSELEVDKEVILENIKLDITYYVPDKTPPEILKLDLEVINENTVNVVWETNEDTKVFVNYGKTSNYGQETPKTSEFAKEGNILITDLNSNITYHMQFVAEDEAENVTESSNSTFSTSNEPSTSNIVSSSGVLPPRLLNLELGSTPEGFKVDLAWSKSDSETIDGYIIYRNMGDDPYIELARLDSSVIRYTDVKVDAGANYSYYVVSYLGIEESSRSPVETVTVPNVSVLGLNDFFASGNKNLAILLICSGFAILLAIAYFITKRLKENMEYNEKINRHSRLHNYLHDPDYYINDFEDRIIEDKDL